MTINWVIYPLKNIKNNSIACYFNAETLDTLNEIGNEDDSNTLGVIACQDEKRMLLNTFVTAQRFVESTDNGAIEPVNNLISGKSEYITYPFDDIDMTLIKKFTDNNPFGVSGENINEDENKINILTLIWSMRVNGTMNLDKELFVHHGTETKIDMFETGDNVMVWMVNSQQIYGVVGKFGLLNDKVVLNITVTKNNTVRYNGQSVKLHIGDNISAPIGSVEKYNPNKVT